MINLGQITNHIKSMMRLQAINKRSLIEAKNITMWMTRLNLLPQLLQWASLNPHHLFLPNLCVLFVVTEGTCVIITSSVDIVLRHACLTFK